MVGRLGTKNAWMDGWMQQSDVSNAYRDDISQLCVILHTLSFTISLGPWQCPCGAKGMLQCVVATRWRAVRKWTCSVLGSWLRPKCRFGKTRRCCVEVYSPKMPRQGISSFWISIYSYFILFSPLRGHTGKWSTIIIYNVEPSQLGLL